MNSIIISAISIASITAITTTFNAFYQLKNNLTFTSSISGHKELKEYMDENNLEYLILVLKDCKYGGCENTIQAINKELADINKRIEYNKLAYIRCYPFLYRFHNSKKRLEKLMTKLINEIEIIKLEMAIKYYL